MTEEVKIAIIDNSINPSIYTPVAHWASFLKDNWHAFTARENQFPNLDDGFTHLILTGSEATILQRDHWVYAEIELALEAIERKIAVLGSCWGHQLLALALAGQASIQRCVCPEVGWIPMEITEEALFGRKGRVFVFSSHFDEVVNLGADFRVFATSELCRVHAFQWKSNSVWGIQSHPEMTIREAKRYLRKNVSSNQKSLPYFQRALGSTARDSKIIHKVIQNFLRS